MYHYHDNWNENSLSFALRIEAQITNARQNLDIGGKIYTLGTIPNNWVKKGEQCETTEKLSQNATEITKFYDSPAAPGLYCAAVQGESHNSSARKIKLVWRITKWLTQRWLIRWSIEKSSSVKSYAGSFWIENPHTPNLKSVWVDSELKESLFESNIELTSVKRNGYTKQITKAVLLVSGFSK